jgi:2,4-dichlorophenol 6-monooxygenase
VRAHAEKHNPSRIIFNHKVVDFNDEGDAVLVFVETVDGRQLVYRAQYVFGADGGKTVGAACFWCLTLIDGGTRERLCTQS